jgi:hypothetical protein
MRFIGFLFKQRFGLKLKRFAGNYIVPVFSFVGLNLEPPILEGRIRFPGGGGV